MAMIFFGETEIMEMLTTKSKHYKANQPPLHHEQNKHLSLEDRSKNGQSSVAFREFTTTRKTREQAFLMKQQSKL
jgi:hypothetical protein